MIAESELTCCSFCNKTKDQVNKIVISKLPDRTLVVCNECISTAISSIVSDGEAEAVTSKEELEKIFCGYCGLGATEITKMVTRSSLYICKACLISLFEVMARESAPQKKIVKF